MDLKVSRLENFSALELSILKNLGPENLFLTLKLSRLENFRALNVEISKVVFEGPKTHLVKAIFVRID